MKKALLLLLLPFAVTAVTGQQRAFQKCNLVAALGYDLGRPISSKIPVPGTPRSDAAVNQRFFGGNMTAEYGVSNKIGLGLSLDYMREKQQRTTATGLIIENSYSYEHNTSTTAFCNFHFARKATTDWYMGVGFTCVVTRYQNTFQTGRKNNWLLFRPQLGWRYYFRPTIGVMVQLGYPVPPSFLLVGAVVKLDTKSR